MEVFFTTVVRSAPQNKGGQLVRLDWTTKKVLGTVSMVPRDPTVIDRNPRGNARGGRGIVRLNELLIAGTYHSLLVFDQELNSKGRITNNLLVGVHELCIRDGVLWVASTAIDGAIGVDRQGRILSSWWPREVPKLQKHLALEPMKIDKDADNRLKWLHEKVANAPNHTHLNALAFLGGQLHALLNRFGIVFNTASESILLEDSSITGCHNLLFLGEKMLINDSRGKQLMVYTHRGKPIRVIDLMRYPEIAKINNDVSNKDPKKRALWLRGLSVVEENVVLIGFSPATIAEINIETGKLLDLFQYSKDVAVCVHGLLAWK